ncbi:ATP-binding cassette domain-containing protein [Candidatus Poribacteria bacterium]|nr:ATP-binding cassette domain-containing protein [Candidatus Poribacteria bacterium]
MDIQHLREAKISTLSTGERQRLLFAKTFLHEPQLWLLDEPLTPLDPGGQLEMIELLGELRLMEKTVVIATNRLEDVPQLCGTEFQDKTSIGILESGRFAVLKTFRDLREESTEADTTETLPPNWLNEVLAQLAS